MDILRVWAWVPKPPALLTAWLQRFSAPVPAEYAEIELWGEVAGGAIFEDLATGDVLEASAFRAKYSQAWSCTTAPRSWRRPSRFSARVAGPI